MNTGGEQPESVTCEHKRAYWRRLTEEGREIRFSSLRTKATDIVEQRCEACGALLYREGPGEIFMTRVGCPHGQTSWRRSSTDTLEKRCDECGALVETRVGITRRTSASNCPHRQTSWRRSSTDTLEKHCDECGALVGRDTPASRIWWNKWIPDRRRR
jgi:hypothetical protein